jgi:hypothetical protein
MPDAAVMFGPLPTEERANTSRASQSGDKVPIIPVPPTHRS